MINKVDIKELQKGICYIYIAMEYFEKNKALIEHSLSLAKNIIKKNEKLSIVCLEKIFDELDRLAVSSIQTNLDQKSEESYKAFVFAFEIINRSLEKKQKDKLFELAKSLIDDEIKKVPNSIIKDVNLEVNIKNFFNKYI